MPTYMYKNLLQVSHQLVMSILIMISVNGLALKEN